MTNHTFYGGLVLSTSIPPSIPFFPASYVPTQHIAGSSNGTVFMCSKHSEFMFMPQRGKSFTNHYTEPSTKSVLIEGFNADPGEESSSISKTLRQHIQEKGLHAPSLCLLDQTRPYGLLSFCSVAVEMYFYGLYNKNESLLVWSDSDALESLLDQNYGNRYLLYRFLPRRDFVTTLPTARVCSRWYRWTQSKDSSHGVRYSALERSIFGWKT